MSKIWALFAIGELHSNFSVASAQKFAKLHYFTNGKMLRVVSERPQVGTVEAML